MDYEQWQKRWDAQQETYLVDREQRLATLLDMVEAAGRTAPRVLDLAGGTGSITRRLLARFPAATSVVLDVDPALLAIATGSFGGDRRVRVCRADLSSPAWLDELGQPPGSFDAVLTATALHWLTEERVAAVYADAHTVLASGGVFANADHMVDEGLGSFNDNVDALERAQQDVRRAQTGETDWEGWWAQLGDEPEMAPLIAERNAVFGSHGGNSHTRFKASASWHVDALRRAGFAHVGLGWRRLGDAVVVGVKA